MAVLVGKYRQMAVDIHTHEALVTFGIKTNYEALENYLNECGDKDLKINLSRYSPTRSLNANAYFHSLCREIGLRMERSEEFMKNRLISEYGQPELMENGERWVIKTNLDLDHMWEQENLHVKPIGTKVEDGKAVFFYAVMRASHTYSVKEMSQLIEGTVQEAKALDIPTISDKQMERLLNAWKR